MFFSSKNKNLFTNLKLITQIGASYNLCKNLFGLTWENAGS